MIDANIIESLLTVGRAGVILAGSQLECRVEAGIYPTLDVTLLPQLQPVEPILQAESCLLFYEQGQQVHLAHAQVLDAVKDRKLQVLPVKTESKPQQRQCLRVDTVVDLKHWPAADNFFQAGSGGPQPVNISGNGIRFTTETELREGELLKLELGLPSFFSVPIPAFGRVKRVEPYGRGCQVAVGLVEIERSLQDKLLGFCANEHARSLQDGD